MELTWDGKGVWPIVEPSVLVEDEAKSRHADAPNGVGEPFENMLIHGDNLPALKSLEQQFVGKVKCVYIDPPYNTGSTFEHYDDDLEHSK